MTPAGQRGRLLADRYELRDRLGQGGAGTVWRGHDRALDRAVAVKLLHADLAEDPDAVTRFRTEATAAAKLTHPNAVLVYDLGRDEDDDYLVMELVDGVNLADILRDGPLLAGLAAAIGRQVASALGTAHAAGVVHRDVKPGNVLVTTGGDAKLADFGIARALGASTARLTRTGTVLGTARYLAPEQLRDEPIDARADVYALGLVLHEVLTGRAPFGEGSAVEVAARRLTTTLPSVTELADGVPPALDDVIQWATRVDPQDRPADGAELARALRPFVPHDASAAVAARVTRVPQRNTTPVTSDRIAPVAPDATEAGTVGAGSVADHAGPARIDHTDGLDAAAVVTASGGRSTARRWAMSVVAAAAVLLVAIGVNDIDTSDTGDDDDPAVPTANDGDAAGEPVALAGSGAHDPGGDQGERSDDAPLAVDGDPGTFWPTETYNSADLGGFDKGGVGLWVELVERTTLDRVEVELSNEGGTLELWASSDGPPDAEQDPDGWGIRLGGGEVPATTLEFPGLPDGEVRTVLLWFTDLPEGGNAFRAEVREVRVFAR